MMFRTSRIKDMSSGREEGALDYECEAPAFKLSGFKTCSQSCFCRREHALVARSHSIKPPELDPHQLGLTTSVHSSIYLNVKFVLDINIHEEGIWVLSREPLVSDDVFWIKVIYGPKKYIELIIIVNFNPLKITLFRGGIEQVVLNGRGLLHMEYFRTKEDFELAEHIQGTGQLVLKVNPAAWFEGNSKDTFWDETFSTSTDTKPKGVDRNLSPST
ncbi:uncharacterized protein F5147DRAFT_742184 [Suillus discolor]|uniref:Uncharacterized protein n=1 Tax=Suillus discolor TaxID=1912936 RepID=A0A9P7FI24_9AGAM|nr:uncharacterized protein F5147DRAFT_742184 [Suillus discolor]KAG2118708.1 hypothetical protein F5147DRAFT_742184 [Suillus discolor]